MFSGRLIWDRKTIAIIVIAWLALAPLVGCEDLPGSSKTQGAVIGGAGGAAAGAAVADENRLLGALIGGVLGAGGGYLIGAQVDKTDADDDDKVAAAEAVEEAQTSPATAEDVQRADTADLNSDGFVTTDEVIAMSRAGLNDREMIARLEATGQVFELTQAQQDELVAAGVDRDVVEAMEDINAEERERLLTSDRDGRQVISKEPQVRVNVD